MITQLKSVVKYVSNCNFYCKDGYHHLPYMGDSPQAMLEGFRNLPFVTVDEKNRLVSTNNLWLRSKMQYIELEAGLWLLIHDACFKANICGKAIYEQTESDYYSLFYNINKSKIKTQSMRFKDIGINSRNCTLHRPGSEISAYIPKGTHVIVVNFMFDRSWAERNINHQSLPAGNNLKNFLKKTWRSWSAPVLMPMLSI